MGHTVHHRVFQGMRKWPVANVVKEDGNLYRFGFARGDGMTLALQYGDGPLHQMHGAQGMVEAGVVGPWIHQGTQAQLTNTAQSLEVGMLNEVKNSFCRNRNETVDRIVEEFELVRFGAGSHVGRIGAVNLTHITWIKHAYFGSTMR